MTAKLNDQVSKS